MLGGVILFVINAQHNVMSSFFPEPRYDLLHRSAHCLLGILDQ